MLRKLLEDELKSILREITDWKSDLRTEVEFCAIANRLARDIDAYIGSALQGRFGIGSGVAAALENRGRNLAALRKELQRMVERRENLQRAIDALTADLEHLFPLDLRGTVRRRAEQAKALMDSIGSSVLQIEQVEPEIRRMEPVAVDISRDSMAIRALSDADQLVMTVDPVLMADLTSGAADFRQNLVVAPPPPELLSQLLLLIEAAKARAQRLSAAAPASPPGEMPDVEYSLMTARMWEAALKRVSEPLQKANDRFQEARGNGSSAELAKLATEVEQIVAQMAKEAASQRDRDVADITTDVRHLRELCGPNEALDKVISNLSAITIDKPDRWKQYRDALTQADRMLNGLADIERQRLADGWREQHAACRTRLQTVRSRPHPNRVAPALRLIDSRLEAPPSGIPDPRMSLQGLRQVAEQSVKLHEIEEACAHEEEAFRLKRDAVASRLAAIGRLNDRLPEHARIDLAVCSAADRALGSITYTRLEDLDVALSTLSDEVVAAEAAVCAAVSLHVRLFAEDDAVARDELSLSADGIPGEAFQLADSVGNPEDAAARLDRVAEAVARRKNEIEMALLDRTKRVSSLDEQWREFRASWTTPNAEDRLRLQEIEVFRETLEHDAEQPVLSRLRSRRVWCNECESFLHGVRGPEIEATAKLAALRRRVHDFRMRGYHLLHAEISNRVSSLLDGVTDSPPSWTWALQQLDYAESLLANVEKDAARRVCAEVSMNEDKLRSRLAGTTDAYLDRRGRQILRQIEKLNNASAPDLAIRRELADLARDDKSLLRRKRP
jgi:hypothetical protein